MGESRALLRNMCAPPRTRLRIAPLRAGQGGSDVSLPGLRRVTAFDFEQVICQRIDERARGWDITRELYEFSGKKRLESGALQAACRQRMRCALLLLGRLSLDPDVEVRREGFQELLDKFPEELDDELRACCRQLSGPLSQWPLTGFVLPTDTPQPAREVDAGAMLALLSRTRGGLYIASRPPAFDGPLPSGSLALYVPQ